MRSSCKQCKKTKSQSSLQVNDNYNKSRMSLFRSVSMLQLCESNLLFSISFKLFYSVKKSTNVVMYCMFLLYCFIFYTVIAFIR